MARAAREDGPRMEPVGEPVAVTAVATPGGEVTCVAACGVRLAAGGGDGALRLWRWRRGLGWLELAERGCAHRFGVTGAQFAVSGVLLASAGVDGTARVWAARTGLTERRALLAPHAAPARCLRWAGGSRLAVGHDDGALRVWAARAGELLAHVRAHDGALHALAAPAGVLLLAACTEGVLKVFDIEDVVAYGTTGGSGPAPLLWEDGAHDMGALCAAEGAGAAATGGRDGLVRLWHAGGGRVARGATLGGHAGAVTSLSWARALLASASLDRTARLWAPAAAACLHVLLAHSRYLTAVALAPDLSYIVTGSNDRSIRTWSLGKFTIDDDPEPERGPVFRSGLDGLEGAADSDPALGNADVTCAWRTSLPAAVTCIAASAERLAAACSDGRVRLFRREARGGEVSLRADRELAAHAYPALAVDFGAGGALLLSAGLDGRVRVWDAQAGDELAVLAAGSLATGAMAASAGGGGGVRDARFSAGRAPRVLVASDAGAAAVWALDPPTADPLHAYSEPTEALACCAWAPDGRVLAVGGAAGALLLLAAPPPPAVLCRLLDAHDLGVLGCDFCPNPEEFSEARPAEAALLATGGRDALLKLWWAGERLEPALAVAAHGGAVSGVRWGGRLLATGGADRWARVWRLAACGGRLAAGLVAAVPAGASDAAVCLLAGDSLLAVGDLAGGLALWRLRDVASSGRDEEAAFAADTVDSDDSDVAAFAQDADPASWDTGGVLRWLREYVIESPDATLPAGRRARLAAAARGASLTGPRLLAAPLAELLLLFGCAASFDNGAEVEQSSVVDGGRGEEPEGATRDRLRDEILWLRRDPLPTDLEARAPVALRCPLSGGVPREPARAADGRTYERQAWLDWALATGAELRSPVSGRRLPTARVRPDYGARDQLRRLAGWPHRH